MTATGLAGLPTPCLVLDRDRMQANIDRMADRARELGVRLRPHVKTCKSAEIARLMTGSGRPICRRPSRICHCPPTITSVMRSSSSSTSRSAAPSTLILPRSRSSSSSATLLVNAGRAVSSGIPEASSLRSVVDSPPGMTSPSQPSSSAGRRTSRALAPSSPRSRACRA